MPFSSQLPSVADLTGRLARSYVTMLREPERARLEMQEVLEQARRIGAKPQEIDTLLKLASCDFLQGRYEHLMLLSEEALRESRQAHLTQLEAMSLNMLGLGTQRLGRIDESMRHFLDCLRLAQQLLNEEAAMVALGNMAMVYSTLGHHEMALRLTEQSLEISQKIAYVPFTANMLANLTQVHYDLGNYEQALELAEEAISFAHNNAMSRFESYTRLTLTDTLLALGRAQAACRASQSGLRVARWAMDAEGESLLHWGIGKAKLALGELEEARENLEISHSFVVQSRSPTQELEIQETRLALALAQGNAAEAAGIQERMSALQAEMYSPEVQQEVQRVTAQVQQQLQPETPQAILPWDAELLELTRSLKRANTGLAHRAAHEPLTGALNRPHFQTRLQKHLDFLKPGELLGVVVCSLDHMKTINELFGQHVGDALLVAVVDRLRETLRLGDLVGRLGSDEFVIMLDFMAQESDLEFVMQKLLRAMRQPFEVREQRVHATVSLGGVLAPRDGQTVEALFNNAEATVQKVKDAGRNAALVFKPNLSAAEQQRRALGYDLRDALSENQFVLHYQPQFRLPGQELQGFEALVRWQHPRLGLLGPGQFIPLAEETRLILDIGDWVLLEACRQAVAWRLPERGLRVAVNVSALQFGQPNFAQEVATVLTATGLSGSALELELTESMVHEDQELAVKHLAALHELDVSVALDDFGTGFSSLNMLHSLSFQTLKVDRSFLRDLNPNGLNYDRVRTLIEVTVNLAHSMHMEVVAEGVETAEQLLLLNDLACDQAQGYLLGRPLPVEQARALLPELEDQKTG